jgi:enoyl-CoA hydratase
MEAALSHETITVEQRDAVTLITLNRPQALNALNSQVLEDLIGAFTTFEADPGQRCAVLTGAGDKAFAAGADIKEMADKPAADFYLEDFFARWTSDLVKKVRKPWIAAVNGFALGGGCELAMACHIRIASEAAKFGQPEVKLGLIPGYGGTQRLPRLVGRGRALQLLLTGEMIDAQEAFRIGLVNRVVAAADLVPAANEMMRAILANAPFAIANVIETVNRGYDATLDDALTLEATAFGLLAATDDKREGTRAFLEQRPPRSTGA